MKEYTKEQMWEAYKEGFNQWEDLDRNYDPSEYDQKIEELKEMFNSLIESYKSN